jgi:hypothetical protein
MSGMVRQPLSFLIVRPTLESGGGVGSAKEAESGSQVVYLLARDNTAWGTWDCDQACRVVTPSGCLCNEFPTFAHACRQCLLVHRLGFHPSPCRWPNVLNVNFFSVIADYAELMDVHSKPYVSENMHQWRESSDMIRFAHVNVVNAEAGYVLLGRHFTRRRSTCWRQQHALRELPKVAQLARVQW